MPPPLVNVPAVAGVPAMNFAPGAALAPVLMTADTYLPFGVSNVLWGIYDGFAPIVVADSVTSLDYRQEWTISDYPVEEGSFESFDKVAIPQEIRIRFATGGSFADKQAMLDSIDAVAGTTNIYSVITPEEFYPSVTIKHYDYRRTGQQGLWLLVVDVWLEQVIVTVPATFGPTAQPSGADTVSGGQVQGTAPTPSQSAAIGSLPNGPGIAFQPGT